MYYLLKYRLTKIDFFLALVSKVFISATFQLNRVYSFYKYLHVKTSTKYVNIHLVVINEKIKNKCLLLTYNTAVYA